ncbi:DUF4296 domain-containing protein [uncultured Bacteroides sp.]|uniref:DUF4296 domain-containing protein n=1 Tax=uncultured Bacteroides sp. TaxID=162156 RepID=UPI00280C1CBC|nr:DUF4296 domain-containing protein [uncultured Bacteroides sp.]
MKKLCFFFILMLTVMACKVKRPDGVIAESQMEELLYDYHLARSMGENLPVSDNYKKALYIQSVFQKYDVTQAEFDSSMVWYTRHTDILAKIYEKINDRLKEEQASINHMVAIRDKKSPVSQPGDSVELWFMEQVSCLTNAQDNNKISFVIPADVNSQDRDALVWKASFFYPSKAGKAMPETYMAMQMIYRNDSVITSSRKITRSGEQEIRLQSDTLGALREVRGYIYFEGGKDDYVLVHNISMKRYRVTGEIAKPVEPVPTDSTRTVKSLPVSKDTLTPQEPVKRMNPEELNHRRRTMPARKLQPMKR